MISDTERARRVALGRHAAGLLRALAGERKGALATVLRALASDIEGAAGNVEPVYSPAEARAMVRAINTAVRLGDSSMRLDAATLRVVGNAYVSRGGDA